MDAHIHSAALVALAAAIAGAVAWARPDLDLRPGAASRDAALASIVPAGALAYFGGGAGDVVFFAALSAVAAIDFRRFLIPNQITYPLICLGALLGIATGLDAGIARLAGAAFGYGALFAIGAFWRRARGVDALGLGDAKLFAAIGAFLGWQALAGVALAAALTGIAFALVFSRRGAPIPFAPPLALGALYVWCFGGVFV